MCLPNGELKRGCLTRNLEKEAFRLRFAEGKGGPGKVASGERLSDSTHDRKSSLLTSWVAMSSNM